ncbi:hypothetical protein P689_12274 [Candidatus Riesia pediculischaeffi PTSU]|uniref:Uncharacterized protein n=1 Tax=Candidatus Riesia pediculischaeffi PTSU TaxID=1401651 RepID=A0A0C1VJ92_9ENTR|nr:hypothetical protein P689_12274 [Candidatus Riesia pediculischaeffi PTSU]
MLTLYRRKSLISKHNLDNFFSDKDRRSLGLSIFDKIG